MPKTVTVKITGLDELQSRLESVPRKIAAAMLARALQAGAKVFLAEMQTRAAHATGFLAEHIGLRLGVKPGNLSGYALVGPLKTDYPRRVPKTGGKGSTISAASVARYLEFGTKKMAAKPFIRQAFESGKQAALDAFIAQAKAGFNEGAR